MLRMEAAAGIPRRAKANPVTRHAKRARDDGQNTERPLEVRKHVERVFRRVVFDDEAEGFHRRARVSRIVRLDRDLVRGFGESSVDLVLQAFASNDDYIEARSNLTEAVRNQLIEHGLNIPYPQRDLHVYHRDADGRPIADILLRGVADDGDATQTSGAAPASKS